MKDRDRHYIVDDNVLLTFGDLDFSIYNAILHNWSQLLDMRVADLAKIAGVSNASVVRFCKKCGYSGFPELKMAFSQQIEDLSDQVQPLPRVFSDLSTFSKRCNKDRFEAEINAAFEILRWTHVACFLGHGRSGGIAEYGASLFCSVGLTSIAITSFPNYLTANPAQDATAIVISYSGMTPMVLSATQELVSKGLSIISITGNPSSSIARISDVCIDCQMPKHTHAISMDMSSRVPAVYAIEELARAIYNADFV